MDQAEIDRRLKRVDEIVDTMKPYYEGMPAWVETNAILQRIYDFRRTLKESRAPTPSITVTEEQRQNLIRAANSRYRGVIEYDELMRNDRAMIFGIEITTQDRERSRADLKWKSGDPIRPVRPSGANFKKDTANIHLEEMDSFLEEMREKTRRSFSLPMAHGPEQSPPGIK